MNVNFGGSSALTLSGAVALTAARTVTVNSPGFGVNSDFLTLSGVISGSFSLTKTGPGSLILSGANTFGNITPQTVSLNQGTLSFGNAAAFGATGNTLTISGSAGPAAIDAGGLAHPECLCVELEPRLCLHRQ